jgi:hypothetical protein
MIRILYSDPDTPSAFSILKKRQEPVKQATSKKKKSNRHAR